MTRNVSKIRMWAAAAAATFAIAAVGAGVAGAAGSATPSGTTTATTAAASAAPAGNPATVAHGPNETLLTGAAADKVTAAAQATVPGGTIVRVESDSGGAAYEAHIERSDGSYVTVKLDASYNVTATQDGFGAGPGGTHP
jgi:hypothetical protein